MCSVSRSLSGNIRENWTICVCSSVQKINLGSKIPDGNMFFSFVTGIQRNINYNNSSELYGDYKFPKGPILLNTMLHAWRLPVPFPKLSLNFSIDLNLPTAIWPRRRNSLQQKWVSGIFLGGGSKVIEVSSKGSNRVSPYSHLRTETDLISETLCFLVIRIPDDGQSPETH
jgi:hypothetical protein